MTRNEFYTGPIYQVVKAMLAQGNEPGLIKRWVASAYQWALDNRGPESEAIKAWVPHFQPRPFYTAGELAPMFPALEAALGLSRKHHRRNYSPGRLANALDYAKLPVLKRDDGEVWFQNPALPHRQDRYYIVERIGHWKKQRLTQEGFENVYYGK